MSRFKNYLLKSLNKEDKTPETQVPLTTICLEVINEYPNIKDTLHDIQNEVKTTSNIVVKLFGMLTILVLKLNQSVKDENNEEILQTQNQIMNVEKRIDDLKLF